MRCSGEAEGSRCARPFCVGTGPDQGRRAAPPLGSADPERTARISSDRRVNVVTWSKKGCVCWGMPYHPARRSLPHFERVGGVVCLTWRLARIQPLLRHEERKVVFESVESCDPYFADLFALVVMDDHAHVLVRPHSGFTARHLIGCWKGMTAQRLVRTFGRSAPMWQRDYFDRWMDSRDQVTACIGYIARNPVRRWPGIGDYPWLYLRR